jgi:hypothetical protein
VWATEFLTMLERPPSVEPLVVGAEQATAVAAALRDELPNVVDPQVELDGVSQLLMVKGEYRTSQIVEPEDGRMPLTPAGADLVARTLHRNEHMFDGPEQRPLAERCMESHGYPPIRTLPVFLPHQVLQTRDHVVIASEDQVGVRIIHLGGQPPPDTLRSIEGHSIGHWDGDTLVVATTHLRAEDPARDGLGRPILLSRDSLITERFTRVSDTELVYRYTVEDPELYTMPWTGEFSLTRHDGLVYEYACNEGNYSMPTILVGGQAEAASQAETERDRD